MAFSRTALRFAVVAAAVGVLATSLAVQADSRSRSSRKPVLTHPKFDASAERVALFDGMDDGRLESKVVANDSTGGFVLITNNSDQPLTVELPDSFVTVQVLKQFGGGGGGLGGGQGGFGGGQGGGQQGGGGNQNGGGGFGGGGQQGGFGGGQGGGGLGGGQGGGNFFSIPPERTVKVPFISACLNHGKPDPNPRVDYKLVRVSDYTEDPVLAELIRMLGTGRVDQRSAQAAIWTRTDNMTWDQLANKNHRGIRGVEYFFTSAQIAQGQMLLSSAEGAVREAGKTTAEPAESSRVR